MLMVILVFWSTILVRIAVCFFVNHDPILRPKPFPCQSLKCLYICDTRTKDHAIVPIEHFGLKNYSDGADKIYFLSIGGKFVAIFTTVIYFFKYSPDNHEHELVLQQKQPFPNQRIIPVGDETVMMTPIFHNKTVPKSTSNLMHLINHYHINTASNSLVLIQSIAFPTKDLKLEDFQVSFALAHNNYSYIIGNREIQRSREMFIGRFCNGYGNYSYAEVRKDLDNADDSIRGVFIVHKSNNDLKHVEQSLFMWLKIDSEDSAMMKPFQELKKELNTVRSECAKAGFHAKQLSSLLAGQASDCKAAKVTGDLCSPIGENLPSSEYWSLGSTRMENSKVTSLIVVHLGFPINKVASILTTANDNGLVKLCFIDSWPKGCRTIGNISELGEIFPPNLDSTEGRIDYYSIRDASTISVNIVDCSYFERCINCRLFSLFFHCKWNGKCNSILESTATGDPNDIALNCVVIQSISPEKIISFDERVSLKVDLNGWDLHEVINKTDYYDLMVFIDGKPCDETKTQNQSLVCLIGDRKKGSFQIYVEISAKENTLFSIPLRILSPFNVTIEGLPLVSSSTNASGSGSPLINLAQGVFCLMVLFILSLRWSSQKEKLKTSPTNGAITTGLANRPSLTTNRPQG